MVTQLEIGDLSVDVVFKDIKNVHLSVYPPTGRVRLSAPNAMPLETIRLFAVSKIAWIRRHQRKMQLQERETPREFLERESHYLWGRRYLLRIEDDGRQLDVQVNHRSVELNVPKHASIECKRDLLLSLYRGELREAAKPVIENFEKQLGVQVDRFFIQLMRTKWGSSNPAKRSIRLNLDLARFEPECLRYVVLHEMAHFLVPNHNDNFIALLDRHMPGWRAVRSKLNYGPLLAME